MSEITQVKCTVLHLAQTECLLHEIWARVGAAAIAMYLWQRLACRQEEWGKEERQQGEENL